MPLIVVWEVGILHLQGHVPQTESIGDGGAEELAVLVSIHGPQACISPAWYPAKQAHGWVVPTWNYQVMQVQGWLRVVPHVGWIRREIDALTMHQESGMDAPWRIDDSPAEYIARLASQCRVSRSMAASCSEKTKTSQNQPEAKRRGVIAELRGLADGRGSGLEAVTGC